MKVVLALLMGAAVACMWYWCVGVQSGSVPGKLCVCVKELEASTYVHIHMHNVHIYTHMCIHTASWQILWLPLASFKTS